MAPKSLANICSKTKHFCSHLNKTFCVKILQHRPNEVQEYFFQVFFLLFLDPPVSVFLARPSFVFFAKQFAVRETSMTSQHHAMECKFWSLWEKILSLSYSLSPHPTHRLSFSVTHTLSLLFFQLKTSTIKDPLLCTQIFYAANISNYSLANSLLETNLSLISLFSWSKVISYRLTFFDFRI